MLFGDDLAWPGRELGTDFATPRAVFEALVFPRRLLNRRNILPGFVVARTVPMMHGIEEAELRLPCGIQDLRMCGTQLFASANSLDAGARSFHHLR